MVIFPFVKYVWNPKRVYTNAIDGKIRRAKIILSTKRATCSFALIVAKLMMIWTKAKANIIERKTKNM